MKEEIKILTEEDPDRLTGEINIQLANGWKLSGELSMVAVWIRDPELHDGGYIQYLFAQRMVKYG